MSNEIDKKKKKKNSSKSILKNVGLAQDSTLKSLLDSLPDRTKEFLSREDPNVKTFMSAFIKGFAGSIKICHPKICDHKNICPLAKAGVAPEGYFCPNEIAYTDARVQEYIDIYKADKTDTIIRVIELVSTQLMIERIESVLAEDGMKTDDPRLVNKKTGEVVFGIREHPLLRSLIDLRKTENDIITSLSKKEDGDNDRMKDALWRAIEVVEDKNK